MTADFRPTVQMQLAWAHASVLLVAAPERRVLEVTGADRLSWLHSQLSCDIATRKAGEVIYGLALAQKGKIVTDLFALVRPDRVLLAVQGSTLETLTASFDRHLMMEDAEVHASPLAVWFLHGPRAADALRLVIPKGVLGGLIDVTGHGGAIVLAGPTVGASLLAEAVAGLGGGVGDEPGWEAVRHAAGVPRFGVDFDTTTYPQEASLEATAMCFSKGCYLGQDVVCMLEMRGHVRKRLASVALDVAEPPRRGGAVTSEDGEVVGDVTSAAMVAPGQARALVMVKPALAERGTKLTLGESPARVV